MTAGAIGMNGTRGNGWRLAAWGSAAALLALPWLAMRYTTDVNWTGVDFAVFGAMLLTACIVFEIGLRARGGWPNRAALAVAVGTGFLLVWVNLAVGFLGDEHNDANLLFLAVFAVAGIGAARARLQPGAMVRVMIATAATQALVAGGAFAAGLATPGKEGVYEVLMGSGLFCTLWLISAGLFALAARRRPAEAA